MRLQKKIFDAQSKPLAEQPIEANQFQMFVPEGGYCWLDDAVPSRGFGIQNEESLGLPPYMVVSFFVNRPGATEVAARTYQPLVETPDLFRRFKDLDLDPDSLLRFANRYGSIGETGRIDYSGTGWRQAVGISHWREEIQAMIVADHLWGCLLSEDRRTLRTFFIWARDAFDVRAAIRIVGRHIRAEKGASDSRSMAGSDHGVA